jgi:hypothetical protein
LSGAIFLSLGIAFIYYKLKGSKSTKKATSYDLNEELDVDKPTKASPRVDL